MITARSVSGLNAIRGTAQAIAARAPPLAGTTLALRQPQHLSGLDEVRVGQLIPVRLEDLHVSDPFA
jgi:hypothetical protein